MEKETIDALQEFFEEVRRINLESNGILTSIATLQANFTTHAADDKNFQAQIISRLDRLETKLDMFRADLNGRLQKNELGISKLKAYGSAAVFILGVGLTIVGFFIK